MNRLVRLGASAPWGLVGMVAMVALGEWAFARCEMDVLLPEHWDWRHTGKAARTAAKGADLLCFGDSLMKASVLPAVLEARTGRTAYNLAVPMGPAPTSYFLFRRALRAGARPSAVLIDATPFLLRYPPDSSQMLRRWPDLLRPVEVLDLAWSARSPTLLARVALARLIPSLRARHEVRSVVTSALQGRASNMRFLTARFLRNVRVNRGASALEEMPEPILDTGPASDWIFENFWPDPVNVAYLDRFLDLAAARGVPAFLVIPPPSVGAERLAEQNGFDAVHTQFVRSLQARHPGLTVLDGRRSGYGPALYFTDPVHLNHVGARAFSEDVSAVVARALDGRDLPRWLDLPRYRARPETVPIEDLGESGMALIYRGAVRR
jgi:hypothetical protein